MAKTGNIMLSSNRKYDIINYINWASSFVEYKFYDKGDMDMYTFSRDGKFALSIPCHADAKGVKEIAMKVRKGKEATIHDVAEAIREDCFDKPFFSNYESQKLKVICHLFVGEKQYDFSVTCHDSSDGYQKEIAEQITM